MATRDEDPGQQPLDPVYASLFRPEPDPDPDPEPSVNGPGAIDDPGGGDEVVDDPMIDDPGPDVGDTDSPAVDTGRLFRSQGVAGVPSAVLAIEHGRQLRTLDRSDAGPKPPPATGPTVDGSPSANEVPSATTRAQRRSERKASGTRGITSGAIYLIIFTVTVLVAFANALLAGGELGWPTGVALLVSTVYCALTVRREDDLVVIITPALAFFVAAITAGQLFRGGAAGGLLNRLQLVFFALAYNWYWIIGATLVAVVIVLVRRHRT